MEAARKPARPGASVPAPIATVTARLRDIGGHLGARHLLLLAFLALHLLLFLVIFPGSSEDAVLRGNLWLFFRDSGRALTGAVPYRDFLLEYPPGALLVMMLPRAFAVGYLQYRTLFFAEAALLDALIVVALFASTRSARIPTWRALCLYTLAIVLLGPLVVYRLDLAPAALTALAVLAWQRDSSGLSAAALALGTATKVYPLLLVPLLLMDAWARHGARRVWRAMLAFGVTLAIVLSPALLAGTTGLARALRFQTERHLQVEAIWAVPVLLLHISQRFPLEIAARGRALVILGPGDAWGNYGALLLALVALAVYGGWWRLRARPELHAAAVLTGTAALVFAAAILSKVLSPQYLIWVMAPLALLPLRPRPTIVALLAFFAALPLTQWLYPLHYGELVRLITPLTVGVLAARDALLLIALAAVLAAFWRLGARPTHRAGARGE